MTLGGTLIVRNAFAFDYCLEAALRSLMGVCDELSVVDGYSDDGTDNLIECVLNDFKGKWTYTHALWKPCAMGTWLADLTNKASALLHTDMHLNLQADEVLHEDDYPLIRKLAMKGGTWTLQRLNFWHDHRHQLPADEKVGSTIVRLAPVSLPSVGDAQGLEHKHGWMRSQARIFHYGFIRDAAKLAAKAKPMQQAFFNTTDPVWEDVEKRGKAALTDPANTTAVPLERLLPYTGTHPKVAHAWLQAHGYQL